MGYRDCDICGAPFATHGSACVRPRQAFTAGTTLSTLDMKDAEIAKLRAERDEAKRTLVSLFDDTKAEIARLRATSEAQRKTIGELEDVSVQWMNETKRLRAELDAARDAVFKEGLARIEAETQLAAARAALAKEREACDEAVRLMAEMSNATAFKCFRSGVQYDADRIIASNRARRAAEAKGAT